MIRSVTPIPPAGDNSGKPTKRFSALRRCFMFSCAGIISLGSWASYDQVAMAKPCAKHPVKASKGKVTRAACLKQYKRDRTAYPKKPTWNEALKRTSPTEQAVMYRIGVCEMGTRSPGYKKPPTKGHPPAKSKWANLRWGLDLPRYSSAFGIWNGNGRYINSATGYSFPGATPAEGLMGAVALARRYGFSAWACY